jgi:hypothetical protein
MIIICIDSQNKIVMMLIAGNERLKYFAHRLFSYQLAHHRVQFVRKNINFIYQCRSELTGVL